LGDLLEQTDIDLGVAGCRVDSAMTEDQTNLVEWHTVTQHLGRRGVPKQMGAFSRRDDSGAP
jgi:hypothetical protein